jgi:Family of unknown function (DUF6152)
MAPGRNLMPRAQGGLLRVALVAALVSSGGGPADAHHSFAMFDTAKPITISGVVTAFEWTNPHVYIELDVADGAKVTHWAIELGSPSILMRGGWKFNTIKKGDTITALVSPLRNGEPGSLLNRVTLADGRVLGNGGPAGIGPGTATSTPPSPQR